MLLRSPHHCEAATAAANFSGDLVSLLTVTHCTSAEGTASLLLEMFLLLQDDAEFLGTVCTTVVAMDVHITQGLRLYFIFIFLSFPLPIILLMGRKERLYTHFLETVLSVLLDKWILNEIYIH